MASSANNANANVPLVQGLLRSCATPGCGKQFWSSSHFHCCSDCPATGGFVHTRRCARHGRYMRRGLRPVVHWCRNPNCNRLAGLFHHRTCCSQCDGAGRHSNRCDHQWQNIQQQQVVVQTQSSSTTAAVGQGANCTSLPTASSAASSSSAVTASNSGTTGVVASQPSDDEKSEVKLDSMD